MDEDEFITIMGRRLNRPSNRTGIGGIRGGYIGGVRGGYIGPNGGLGALPTVGSVIAKPKLSKPPKDEKKD